MPSASRSEKYIFTIAAMIRFGISEPLKNWPIGRNEFTESRRLPFHASDHRGALVGFGRLPLAERRTNLADETAIGIRRCRLRDLRHPADESFLDARVGAAPKRFATQANSDRHRMDDRFDPLHLHDRGSSGPAV